ncbi:hypothetical protein [Rhodopirellula islandica]|uniref:hypothetical protein n=1 Tax=Rhodopirellula islandica TaxID=595434 RepID=UPI00123724A7|nr:hypothetical protein [Rhodopirellula islandica]
MIAMPKPIKKKKPAGEVVKFYLVNAIVIPSFGTLGISIAAQGIRELLPIMRTRLHRAVPGAEFLRDYQSIENLDLSHVASCLLFLAVTVIWIRVISEFKGVGPVMGYRKTRPFAFGFYAIVASTILIADAFVFFIALAARNNGWSDAPAYVPVVCTCMYAAGIAAFAAFHQSYYHPDHV